MLGALVFEGSPAASRQPNAENSKTKRPGTRSWLPSDQCAFHLGASYLCPKSLIVSECRRFVHYIQTQ